MWLVALSSRQEKQSRNSICASMSNLEGTCVFFIVIDINIGLTMTRIMIQLETYALPAQKAKNNLGRASIFDAVSVLKHDTFKVVMREWMMVVGKTIFTRKPGVPVGSWHTTWPSRHVILLPHLFFVMH